MQPALSLPVHWSLLRVDALARALEEAYGLSQVHCQPIKATINDTYQVWASEGRFVLRISRAHQRSADDITAELAAMTALAVDRVKVAAVVPLWTGELLLPIQAPEGVRYAVLFTLIEGVQLSKAPDAGDVRRYGRTVAAMHDIWDEKALTVTRPRLDATRLIDAPLAALASVLTHPQDVANLQRVGERVRTTLRDLPETPPLFGLIHGDLIPSNTLLRPDGTIVLLDFDFCGWGWRVYDLASYLLEIEYWGAAPTTAEAFLQGYEEKRVLDSLERDLLPTFEVIRAISSLGTPALHVNEWGSAYLTEQMVTIHLEIIQRNLLKMR
jgi:Ser/Thr protein kinase RdoA (MazF antagonist)